MDQNYEGDPSDEISLSLYAIDRKYYEQISEYFKADISDGKPLIPMRYLLNAVNRLIESS